MSLTQACLRCGKRLPGETPQGLCPDCLSPDDLETLHETITPTSPVIPTDRTRRPPSIEELARCFPNFEILELLGQGGMGFVFKARQLRLNRLVALKILPRELATDPAFEKRFIREARSLARLNHPHILTVFEFGQASSYHYLVMEYVDGFNLRQKMRQGRLGPDNVLSWISKLGEALQYAHDAGIIHRDIKPENILIDKQDRLKVADFGIAKLIHHPDSTSTLTEFGQQLGSPRYMAPEQIETPHAVDQRADIYALGVVFYEMLTGELPIGKFAPPSHRVPIDVRLDRIVLRTLEKQPGRRYQRVGDVKTEVEQIQQTRDRVSPASGPGRFGWRYRPSLRTTQIVAGLVLCLAAVVLSFPPWLRVRAVAVGQAIDASHIFPDGSFDISSGIWAEQWVSGYQLWQGLLFSGILVLAGVLMIWPRLLPSGLRQKAAVLSAVHALLVGLAACVLFGPPRLRNLPVQLAGGTSPLIQEWKHARVRQDKIDFVRTRIVTLSGVTLTAKPQLAPWIALFVTAAAAITAAASVARGFKL